MIKKSFTFCFFEKKKSAKIVQKKFYFLTNKRKPNNDANKKTSMFKRIMYVLVKMSYHRSPWMFLFPDKNLLLNITLLHFLGKFFRANIRRTSLKNIFK